MMDAHQLRRVSHIRSPVANEEILWRRSWWIPNESWGLGIWRSQGRLGAPSVFGDRHASLRCLGVISVAHHGLWGRSWAMLQNGCREVSVEDWTEPNAFYEVGDWEMHWFKPKQSLFTFMNIWTIEIIVCALNKLSSQELNKCSQA